MEGESAGGTAKQGRDRRYQAIRLTKACTRPPQKARRRVMPESLDGPGGRALLGRMESWSEYLPMRNEFTAVVERDGDWYIAYCPEIPGPMARGEPRMKRGRVWPKPFAPILEDRREDSLRGVPADAERDTVVVE